MQQLGALVLFASCVGCSMIYNPSGIETRDATIDADPSMLALVDVFPATIDEGAGCFGSRPALLVIQGHNLIDAATVALTSSGTAMVSVVSQHVSADHEWLALAIKADIDPSIPQATPSYVLGIDVTQAGITKSLTDAVTLVGHKELTSAPASSEGLEPLYSMIDLDGGITFTAGAYPKAILRSVSSIQITGPVVADAADSQPGPGGCAGGAKNTDGVGTNAEGDTCAGKGYAVQGGLLNGAGGGGAGLASAGDKGAGTGGNGGVMVGTPQIASLIANIPSGGGGGAANTSFGGGAGGGGGGIVELTGGGDVTISTVSASGGTGGAGESGGGGGGGAGGVILVRAGGTLSSGALTADRGAGGTGGNAGGQGSPGRTRIDAAHGMVPSGTNLYVGPMFVDAPIVTTQPTVTLKLNGSPNTSDAVGRVYDKSGAVVGMTFTPNFGMTGTAMTPVTLTKGYNKVCVTVKDGTLDPVATNCIEIAYLP